MSTVTTIELTPDEQAVAHLLGNLEDFCAFNLQIKPKVGRNVPFFWNKAQRYIHERLEQQIEQQMFVRAILLKGRQQGASTYVGARFYHKSSMNRSTSAFIVAHEDKATNNLYGMVKRYHEWNPMAPSTKYSNAQELIFGELDGGYKLATAGSEDVGRSNTAQLLHGSEFGFWRDAQKHMAGLGNTIADEPGTEIILESTGNGMGNAFHLMWQEAEAGRGLYIPIFVPWFWEPGYRAALRGDLELSDDDMVYMRAYDLDMEQMQWRANKISSYGEGFAWLFNQEYPATPALAFQSSTMNPLISPTRVQAAVNSRMGLDHVAPTIMGVDPAEEGADRTAIVYRQGRVVPRVEYHDKLTPMEVAGKIAEAWRDTRPDAIFVDKIGIGAGIVDRCKELNIPVIGVNSGNKARDPELFDNRRAEMWWSMRDWFVDEPVRIPNDAALIADLSAPQPTLSSNGRKLLEKKEKMRARGVRSPDGGDALALTFYDPVIRRGNATGGGRNANPNPATTAGY